VGGFDQGLAFFQGSPTVPSLDTGGTTEIFSEDVCCLFEIKDGWAYLGCIGNGGD